MPEGHTIHRLARDLTRHLGGRPVGVSSPQGRFAADATRIDGAVLERVEAWGKHLFFQWATGEVGHVHLGLFGRFRVHRGSSPPPPRGAVRMRLVGPDATVDLSGPTACSLAPPDERDAIVARLGPDPLRDDADPEHAIAAMGRSRRPIGALLLDQSVLAGVGNVYRAEALFVCGIHPRRPGTSCAEAELRRLWDTVSAMLGAGVRSGRIVTVSKDDLGLPPSARIPRREATYVYKRDRCLRCTTPIVTSEIGNRTCYHCPTCQLLGHSDSSSTQAR